MYRKIIKVFLGSPGDLNDERKAAKDVVDQENANHANELGYHIELVAWEDTVSQRRRAQDAINVDLDQCEYFVGLMWKKWGTPPGQKGHPYTSGFEEEYRRSVERHETTGKPEISLLFRNIPTDDLIDPGKQLAKVLNFKKELNEGKKQYYQDFQDVRDFEQKFRAIIAKFLRDQQLEDRSVEAIDPQKPKTVDEKGKDQQKVGDQKQIFEDGARNFIADFLDKEEAVHAYSAAEAARFRLLACSVAQSGNDGLVLGTHDANLIYRYLRSADLSKREKSGLVSAGLENLESSTIPIWHWIFDKDFELLDILPFRTVWGSDRRKRNAFRLLERLSIAPKDFEGQFDRRNYPGLWFADDTPDDLVVAALEYIASVGDEEIEVDWVKLIGNSEANVAQAAVRARARITARANSAEALRFVVQHENTDLGRELTKELLSNVTTIETELLRGCLRNRTTVFLAAIASELSNRAALTKSDAQLLCENIDAEIRLIGVKALVNHGPALALSNVRKLLVKPRKANALSLFSSPQERDYSGERVFEEYKIGVLSERQYDDLLDLQKNEDYYSTEATLAIFSSYFNKVKDQLGKDLIDGFEKFYTVRRESLLGTPSEPSASLFSYIRDALLQSALEVFCCKASKSDLSIVREVVDKYEIKFAAEIAGFFAKHGEWEDAVRLAKLSGKFKNDLGKSLLSIVDRSGENRLIARSILKLSSKRIADAWKLELSSPVRIQLIVQMPKKLFSAFEDQGIIEMLQMEGDAVREAVALKSVLCLSKSRLSKIQSAYYDVDGGSYYNAIFWLDLGIAAHRTASQMIALKELGSK